MQSLLFKRKEKKCNPSFGRDSLSLFNKELLWVSIWLWVVFLFNGRVLVCVEFWEEFSQLHCGVSPRLESVQGLTNSFVEFIYICFTIAHGSGLRQLVSQWMILFGSSSWGVLLYFIPISSSEPNPMIQSHHHKSYRNDCLVGPVNWAQLASGPMGLACIDLSDLWKSPNL